MDKTCGVRIFKGACLHCGTGTYNISRGCDHCRIGCFNPARMRNPFFGIERDWSEDYWWRGMYSHVEWMCAEHYDEMIAEMRDMEEMYAKAWTGYEEDPEFTRILEKL